METKVNPFVASYIETALWSSSDDDGEPLDSAKNCELELADETTARMATDCESFEDQSDAIVNVYCETHSSYAPKNRETMAHDFWLTRNGHGCGFWDGDYPESLGRKLTDLTHSFSECDLYIGDDGKLYL